MKQLLIGIVAVLLLLAGCATPSPEQEEPKVVDFPNGYGFITERPEEPLVSSEVSPEQQDDDLKPEEVSETEVVQEQPDKPDVPVVQPPAPEMPVLSKESIEPVGEIAAPEEPDISEEQLPASDEEKIEQDDKPKEDAAVAEQEEPAREESKRIVEQEQQPAPSAPKEAETETAAAVPEDDPEVAADREEDEQSTLLRAAWIGLPILLIMLVILIVEMMRWFIYRKPLFGWSGEGSVSQPYGEKISEGVHVQKKEKKGISARISTYLDNLYKDLEEDDDEEDEKES